MTYTPPLSSDNFTGPAFGLVWLGLATAAYIQENNSDANAIANAIEGAFINGSIQAPPNPSDSTGKTLLSGYWNVDWGPAITDDRSNLLFLVSFREGARPTAGGTQGDPYFFAVCIRGTDIAADPTAVAQQILQDFNAFTVVSLKDAFSGAPNPAGSGTVSNGGFVSRGTSAGFNRMAQLTAGYAVANADTVTGTVADAVLAYLNAYPGVPLVVTGHSLGGCQTQIMSAYLQWQVAETASGKAQAVYPNPFAPSTAGDRTFASYYDGVMPYGQYWFNTLDVVPCGFSSLQTLNSLWQTYTWPTGSTDPATNTDISGTSGPTVPSDFTTLANGLPGQEIALLHYARPSNGQHAMTAPSPLPTPQTIYQLLEAGGAKNAAQTATNGWGMLEWQHFPPCYHALVGAVSGVIPYPLVNYQD